MRNLTHCILVTLRGISFVLMLTALLVQPVLKSSGILDAFIIELAQMDFDEESSEHETQEEENNSEEIVLHLSNLEDDSFFISESAQIYSASIEKWCFCLEKHLPPPELLA